MSKRKLPDNIAGLGRIAVLMGGDSPEREISLLSGNAAWNSLRRLELPSIAIDAGRDVAGRLADAQADFVIVMLHGRGGEDGSIQGLLEVLGLPYSGSGVLASALAMDKIKSKLIWRQLGYATAEFMCLDADTDWDAAIAQLGPAVVKPVAGGSSLGVGIVHSAVELERQFSAAAAFDSPVMAETYIQGREFSVGVLQDELLPAVELRTRRRFFDYQAKYEDRETEYICPPELAEDKHEELLTLAHDAYRGLGCRGLARVDLMQDRAGTFFLLEVNTVPGMTGHSIIPMAASRLGRSYDDLMTQILNSEAEALQS